MLFYGVRSCIAFLFIANDLLSALVKVDIEEDKLFDPWHFKNPLEVEVNFLPFIPEVFI